MTAAAPATISWASVKLANPDIADSTMPRRGGQCRALSPERRGIAALTLGPLGHR